MTHDPAISDALQWLDSHAGWPAGEPTRRVGLELGALDIDLLETRAHRRGSVGRAELAEAVAAYYPPVAPHRFYSFMHAGQRRTTSVLTRPDWLDLRIGLSQGRDNIVFDIVFDAREGPPPQRLHGHALAEAIRRLAGTLATGTRIVNAPISGC